MNRIQKFINIVMPEHKKKNKIVQTKAENVKCSCGSKLIER